MERLFCSIIFAALVALGTAHREEYGDFDLDLNDQAGLTEELLARARTAKRHIHGAQAALIQKVSKRNDTLSSPPPSSPSPTDSPPLSLPPDSPPLSPPRETSSLSPPPETAGAQVVSPSQQQSPPAVQQNANRDPCAKGSPVDLEREAPGCDEARSQKKTFSWWSKSHHQKFISQLIDMCDKFDDNRKSVAKTYASKTKESAKLEEQIDKLDRELKDLERKLDQANRQLRVKMDNLCSENERLQKANELRDKAIDRTKLHK
jgi:archaellum component FlaC